MSTSRYSVILPTYNESQNIGIMCHLLSNIFAKLDAQYELIIVDDNSPDNTQGIVNILRSHYPIKLVANSKKSGLTNAYLQGITEASYEYVIIMDADMSHDPKDIFQFINKASELDVDIVVGSRYLPSGGVYNWPLSRRIISSAANVFYELLLNLQISDCTGSYRLYKKKTLLQNIRSVKSRGFFFQPEILYFCIANKSRVAESPIVFYQRIHGSSKFCFKEILDSLYGIYRLVKHRIRHSLLISPS